MARSASVLPLMVADKAAIDRPAFRRPGGMLIESWR